MNDEPVKYVCEECGHSYIPKRAAQKFCCRSCSFRHLRESEHSDIADDIIAERGYRIGNGRS